MGGEAAGESLVDSFVQSNKVELEVGYDSPGYAVNFGIVTLIFLLHALWYVQVRRMAHAELDHEGRVPNEGLEQKGYRSSRIGTCIQMLSILYAMWMQISLIITIASNYRGEWPYSPGTSSEVNQAVSWDSFTRAFLLPWIGTFCILATVRAYRDELTTFYMSPCSLQVAAHVRIHCVVPDESGNPVSSQGVLIVQVNEDGLQYLEWQLLRLVFCPTTMAYTASPADSGVRQGQISGKWAASMVEKGGLTADDATKLMRGVQGTNEISIEVPRVWQGCVAEFYNMFYIYQLFAITISFYWDYVSVGLMFATLVLICGFIKVYTERQQRLKLREMATMNERVWCQRAGTWAQLPCADLCVGDVICVCISHDRNSDSDESHVLLAADAVMVQGNAVVDESLLTGESMPIQKFEVSTDSCDSNCEASEDKKLFLFAGTQLLHATGGKNLPATVPDGAIAVVAHVGPRSCRGGLLRTLLFGAPLKLAMHTEALLVLGLLFCIGALDFLLVNYSYSFTLSSVISASFMVIAIISPLLSVAILGGQLASAQRLSAVKEKPSPNAAATHANEEDDEGDVCSNNFRIFVRDIDRVALAGKLDVMCFDKTGTITKSGLDLIGFVPVSDDGGLGGYGADMQGLVPLLGGTASGAAAGGDGGGVKGVVAGIVAKSPRMAVALAVTHTVSRLQTKLIGHQVELRMVEATEELGSTYSEDMKRVTMRDGEAWRTDKKWSFDHHTMTMSVITTREAASGDAGAEKATMAPAQESIVCVKGSFEGISARCADPVSSEWARAVDKLSSAGCYVIAVALRSLSPAEAEGIEALGRDTAEAGLQFLGLIAFRNEPKADSAACLAQIQGGGIDTVMITGDSALTGIAIARNVGLVPADHRVVLGSISKTSREISWRVIHDPAASSGAADGSSGAEQGGGMVAPASSLGRKRQAGPEDVELEVLNGRGAEGGGGRGGCRVSIAVTGEAFEALLDAGTLAEHMLCHGCGAASLINCSCSRIRIFGRMTPQQKIQVVRHYAAASLTVGMCGDGGNDSGALRAAHAGLSLGGSAEASVAAPFSTNSHSLAALVLLMREGRASLCTSFGAYRFLVVRGIVWTQAKNVMLIMSGLYLAPLAYLYLDCIATAVLVWAITQAQPARTLAKERPEGSLLGPQNVLSAAASVLLYLVVLAVVLGILFGMPFYIPYELDGPIHKWQARSDSFESPLFFLWASWFTIDLALVVSKGHTHRMPLMHNKALMAVAAGLGLPVMLLLLMDETDFNCAFKVNCDRETYRGLRGSWVNNFLFSYEQIGGDEWYAPNKVATTYSAGFKVALLAVFIAASFLHHLIYGNVISGAFVQAWIPKRLGWNDKRAERIVERLRNKRGKHLASTEPTSRSTGIPENRLLSARH